jgi:hypothetical protein
MFIEFQGIDLPLWLYAIDHGERFERHCDQMGNLPTNKATLKRKLTEALAKGKPVRLQIGDSPRDRPDEGWWEFYGLTGNPGPYDFVAPTPEVLRAMMEREEIGGPIRKPRRKKKRGQPGGPL